MMEISLQGRVVLVTGGTGGLGTAICRQLTASGAKVATNYRNAEKAKQWQEELRKDGYEVGIFQGDVTDYESCAKLAGEIADSLGPVDILINNAGITRDVSFRKMSREQWDDVMSVNLDGVFNITRQVIQGMIDRGFGRVINISSVNGEKGQFGQTNYAAAKAGMHGFTMSLAQEVARKGVTVNTVSPGYLETEMTKSMPQDILDQIRGQIPVGRLGSPHEVACLINYLTSDLAGFITGADLSINGGQHMM